MVAWGYIRAYRPVICGCKVAWGPISIGRSSVDAWTAPLSGANIDCIIFLSLLTGTIHTCLLAVPSILRLAALKTLETVIPVKYFANRDYISWRWHMADVTLEAG